MQQESATRTSRNAVVSAMAAAAGVRFPGEDGGQSLGAMAQRDLDAALQLLADRAQYITGSSGAAIALRRGGKKDMLCRASSGANAPELGALLSTEFGLSGESVRTRQLLRCDDAERDARVNREACRELGIASVAVMPVVNDDEVLGVFELFSGKANAFGERDFAALRRLSEMVETAVRLARAAEHLPEKLKADSAAVADTTVDILEDPDAIIDVETEGPPQAERSSSAAELNNKRAREFATPDAASVVESVAAVTRDPQPAAKPPQALPAQESVAPQQAAPPAPAPHANKPLLWSLALDARGDTDSNKPDESHLPAAFRNLRKCEACGFPVSPGRTYCVECEEKKWRGQLKLGQKSTRPR